MRIFNENNLLCVSNKTMLETLSPIIVFFIIYAGLKMFRGLFCCQRTSSGFWSEDSEIECMGKEPFYVIIISSKDFYETLTSEIKVLKTNNAFAVIVVNDDDIYSEYTNRVKEIVRSLLKENNEEQYHPIIAFKTSQEYKNNFIEDFEDVCYLDELNSPKDLLVAECPA